MKKTLSSRTVRHLKALVVGLAFGAALMASTPAAHAVESGPASAALVDEDARSGCFRSAAVSGINAFGTNGENEATERFVRVAPTASICIKYARLRGGYYMASAACDDSYGRLVTGKSLNILEGKNTVVGFTFTALHCRASLEWEWDRTFPVANECATVTSSAVWRIDQSTGSVWRDSTKPIGASFYPTCD